MELGDYLKEILAPSSVKRYQMELSSFFSSLEAQGTDPVTANYQEVMNYVGELRSKKRKDIQVSLSAIKKYYSYLLSTGDRKDNPAGSIRLRDHRSRDIQLQDLFSTSELELLLGRKERYEVLKYRNNIIISLLIYQGLTNGEITRLELKDIDLESGTVYIKSGIRTNGRTLKLRSKQVYWLVNYIEKDRKQLLQKSSIKTDQLILNKLGKVEQGEGISCLIETQKHLFPCRKLNSKTIRQSVITNLLKSGKDLRIVQAFAGHKYPSATERYKQCHIEELKAEILKYHPLG